tara:strand:+ start:37 stop:330 length:294 start_codon:yes stop_codon:yes gene_type:complete
MKKNLKNKIFFVLFLIISCNQNFDNYQFNKQASNYKICLKDANHNIEKNININQERIDMLQTDDTMIDLYNIGNDIDEIKLSQRRQKMIEDCMKSVK